jgi:glycosyltransferase involved in cell wall biosynthesis
MRVLVVSPAFYPAVRYGGPTRSIHSLCLALGRVGCTVRVLTTNTDGDDVLDVPTDRDVPMAPNVTVRYCARVVYHDVSPRLAAALPAEARRADVVHLQAVYSFPTFPTLAIARLLDMPLVWSPRGALQRWERTTRVGAKWIWERGCRALLPRRAAFHTTAAPEAEATAARMPGIPVAIVPNGVDVPAAIEPRGLGGRLEILFLGRLHPIKGIDRLLAALRRIERGDLALTIAGDGDPSYRAELERLVSELGLDGRVSFVGFLDGEAKSAALRRAHLLVLPSHSENFGMAAAEALAHGTPVVAARGTPWHDLDRRGCGTWCDNEPAELARGIDRVLSGDLAAMGERGRAWMHEAFSWDHVAREMRVLYEKVLRV